jgi:hypothetical protein
MKTVEMEMKNVELRSALADLGKHGQMSWYVPR